MTLDGVVFVEPMSAIDYYSSTRIINKIPQISPSSPSLVSTINNSAELRLQRSSSMYYGCIVEYFTAVVQRATTYPPRRSATPRFALSKRDMQKNGFL